MTIIPSLFVPDKQTFLDQMTAIETVVDMVQLDIADGVFVNATTWGDPNKVADIAHDIRIELHLMVKDPIKHMLRWADVPQVTRVLFHYESNDAVEECIAVCVESGWQPSLVLNPDTPINVIAPYAEHLFGVMLMGVHPGAQGQSYIKETTTRLHEVHTRFPHLFLELDGGVNMDTLPEILTTGLDAICPGSAVFGAENPAEAIAMLRRLIGD